MHLSRIAISVAVGIAAILWGAYLLIFEKRLPCLSDLAPFTFVVSGLLLIGAWFEYKLWRIGFISKLVKRPDLIGAWEGELVSSHVDPKTGEPTPPIHCVLAITQRFSYLQLRQMTQESESWLIADDIKISGKGEGYQVVGVYTNKPGADVRERSEIHYGALLLDTHGPREKPTSLIGEYWTDRRTIGKLCFTRRIDKVHTRYDDASSEFEKLDSGNRPWEN